MTLHKAILTVEADVDGDGTFETGEFHMAGNIEIVPSLRTGFVLDNRGSTINSVVSSTVGSGESKRKGIYLDLGGGVRSVEVSFDGWEGSSEQWGDTGDGGPTKADATGEDPLTQLEVLFQYLSVAEIDSRNPATLEYGEHYSDGLYDPLDVVLESPQGTRTAENGSTFSGSLAFLSVQAISDVVDGANRTG
ncbi:hypothetical protein [Haloarcula sp. K1]|uniref:hypothetical protein n=1 Tax=Haloarcula sp. K1 TaxID=1622207 RepID=UPI0007BC4D26|nr:hypothetical protein [Haloarcula sp. K1]KZX49301.1 hypothetical protein AV929_12210 [Haloarcula sp. K1]